MTPVPLLSTPVGCVTAIETNLFSTTSVLELLVIDVSVAVIVVDPTAVLVARPVDEIVAAAVFEEFHVTEDVKFAVVPSE